MRTDTTNAPLRFHQFCCLVVLIAVTFGLTFPASAQTFTVLHTFTGGAGGLYPTVGPLARDSSGNLYGATIYGGQYTPICQYSGNGTGCGLVYKLTHHGSAWLFNVLYAFNGMDGYQPSEGVTLASDGTICGATFLGGPYDGNGCRASGCGTVFRLRPPATFCPSVLCPWSLTELHEFQGEFDGAEPNFGSLTFDGAGNLYGTTELGGFNLDGSVYELSRNGSGWTKTILYSLHGGADGQYPFGGVVFDSAGNLYGTTTNGGTSNTGTVYKLTHSQGGWSENVLHSFNSETDGESPSGNLVIDALGNLYGGASSYGPNGGGTVWQLRPNNGGWTFTVLYAFAGEGAEGPSGGLAMDAAGNLYGAALVAGAHNAGSIFKLTPNNGGWIYSSLYDFTGGADGEMPLSALIMDSAGNLFGTTELGGSVTQECPSGCGVAFELTP